VIRFTEKELKDIKHVIVTVHLKDDKANKIKGLFLGYRPLVESNTQLVSNDEYFIWIYKGENVYMLNVDHYDVYTIEIKAGHITTQYSTASQEIGIGKLKIIYESLIENKRTIATGLIDISTYDITEKIKKDLGTKTDSTSSKDASLYGNTKSYNNRSKAVNYSTPYKRKEVSTTTMKRSTRYPISTAIEKMKAKIEEIKNDEYKSPVLAVIPADKEKSEDAKKSKGVIKDDDLYGSYYSNYGYGMMG
jgi:hypothetical protein